MILLYGKDCYPNYAHALEACGAAVCRNPELASRCKGLLLPGGGDIQDALDEEERFLIQYFVSQRRPVLGICRGMQALNLFFGGTLYDYVPGHQIAEADLLHPTVCRGSLAQLLGRNVVVNSNHHQAISLLGSDLDVLQWSTDGVAEGICHRRLPILGLQWHPERQSFALRRADAADAQVIFQSFIHRARSSV